MIGRDGVEDHVELDGTTVLAGRAQFQRSRGLLKGTTFQYENGYLARSNSYEIDPSPNRMAPRRTRLAPLLYCAAGPGETACRYCAPNRVVTEQLTDRVRGDHP